jgi:hypothetical protein
VKRNIRKIKITISIIQNKVYIKKEAKVDKGGKNGNKGIALSDVHYIMLQI